MENPLVTTQGMKSVPAVTAVSIGKLIKHQLIQDMLSNPLEHFSPYSENDETGEVGRAYAAQITSVINYGFNVANRAELRDETTSELDTISWGESAIDMDLSHSGRYIRSETGHPAREYYQDILSLLTFSVDADFAKLKQTLTEDLLRSLWLDNAPKDENRSQTDPTGEFKKQFNKQYLLGKDEGTMPLLEGPESVELKFRLDQLTKAEPFAKLLGQLNKSLSDYKNPPLTEEKRQKCENQIDSIKRRTQQKSPLLLLSLQINPTCLNFCHNCTVLSL
ncbi:hypothetical protein P4S72_25085 [Vibrio sp. PP-XX7]